MTNDDKITDEKVKYEINKEAAKTSALKSRKIDKYEFLTSREILTSHQSRITEQAKFTYSPLGKAFEKQIKTIKDQGTKPEPLKAFRQEVNQELKSIKGLFTKKMKNNKIKKKQMKLKEFKYI